jgi:hypothetical protein
MPRTLIGGHATVSTTTQSNEKAVPAVPLQIELRDWFAGQALAGIGAQWAMESLSPDELAEAAYAVADAMLAARQTTDREDRK